MEVEGILFKRSGALGLNGGIEILVRKSTQDCYVAQEVLRRDCYGMTILAHRGFSPRVVLDIGANIGAFACLAKHLWPKSRVIAVEPATATHELLQRNAPHVEHVQSAVCYGVEQVEFFYSEEFPGVSYVGESIAAEICTKTHSWATFHSAGTVSTLTLERLCAGEEVDILKIDCEGSEWNILARMEIRPRIIVGEWHGFGGLARIDALLSRNGYVVEHSVYTRSTGIFTAFYRQLGLSFNL